MRWEVTNEIWKIVHKLMLLLVYVDAAVVVGCLVFVWSFFFASLLAYVIVKTVGVVHVSNPRFRLCK